MSNKLKQLVGAQQGKIYHIAYCPHTPDDNCNCRKPKTGLYLEIATKLNKDLTQSIVIGDSLRDVEAGAKVGAKCFLVRTGKGIKAQYKVSSDVQVFDDLQSITQHLLNTR
ncbi:Histidinol-phosphatase [hydrothermal vent metagenome]|uniref:Histidinol-phosphatase n=1 Tax=hydrothermal vent metagenome TaxID=652676 RepID=A0A1W1CHC8_9ZZZZ